MPAYPKKRHRKSDEIWPILCALKAARHALGVTQKDFAPRLCVSYDALRSWESGDRCPTLINLHRWAKALGMSIVVAPEPVDRGW